ncbi:MAG: pyridine nucleotide-disulfide oxidoreductase [Sphingomonadales bacterium BRH_c42]|jgi:glutathione reductase (NADPH)|nr:MAG: pyridine nucleotide-disulfide oxidoreductase [Sphingomonadales bacterium BRH_c42]
MTKSYDLAIIGSGTAAMVAANRMAAAGKRVAVIDYRPFGGTCALRGCDPKKMLITGAQVMDDIRRMRGRGVAAEGAHIDWRDLMKFKRTFTGPVPAKQEKNYADKGVDTYHEHARFAGRNEIQLEQSGIIAATHVLIATGARPAPLGFPGEEYLIDNERFLELDELPTRIVLVGGGYIASEFSHIAARSGAKVTILQRGPRLLPQFDGDLVGWLMESFDAAGIDVRTGHAVEAIEQTARGYTVRARTADGEAISVEADLVVHAAGRIPDVADLCLDAAEVECDDRGHLKLNEHLQSVTNPSVYAAGDAAGMGPPLTPVSSHDAKVVVGNLLDGNSRRPDYRAIPSVAFTIPPIASVGLSEDEAISAGLKFKRNSERASNWYTARRVAESVYGFKVLVEDETNLILGAHLVGPHVDEVINVFGLAMRHRLTIDDLESTMFAYPTGASDIGYML